MRSAAELIDDFLEPLSILLFGPGLEYEATEEIARGLQEKRQNIRAVLEDDGHHVRYGEEVIDATLPPPTDNPFLQERLLAGEFDLIVLLVQTPGTIVEVTMIAMIASLARKTVIFICDQHRQGMTRHTCAQAQTLGADVNDFEFPRDITNCHLLSRVQAKVRDVQIAKGFSE